MEGGPRSGAGHHGCRGRRRPDRRRRCRRRGRCARALAERLGSKCLVAVARQFPRRVGSSLVACRSPRQALGQLAGCCGRAGGQSIGTVHDQNRPVCEPWGTGCSGCPHRLVLSPSTGGGSAHVREARIHRDHKHADCEGLGEGARSGGRRGPPQSRRRQRRMAGAHPRPGPGGARARRHGLAKRLRRAPPLRPGAFRRALGAALWRALLLGDLGRVFALGARRAVRRSPRRRSLSRGS
mmetsp:Transcript_158823/g.509177  ORF Transcript_158823/g.509177 Transcript_158823/m.509177 type:complete len:239 (+) Transcript_158823:813-1529(+)